MSNPFGRNAPSSMPRRRATPQELAAVAFASVSKRIGMEPDCLLTQLEKAGYEPPADDARFFTELLLFGLFPTDHYFREMGPLADEARGFLRENARGFLNGMNMATYTPSTWDALAAVRLSELEQQLDQASRSANRGRMMAGLCADVLRRAQGSEAVDPRAQGVLAIFLARELDIQGSVLLHFELAK